LNRTQINNAVL